MFFEQYIGKTLSEIDSDIGSTHSICVFLLRYTGDTTGKLIAEEFDLATILSNNPELKTKRVIYVNNYFGELVLRVI